ncbi:hypothetical protein QWZ04_01060 [Vibrio tapetis subsp. quintayensis]|uniref:hypothetical protein n=1 Tax=Vibrio tapetis TaxID=52443 RepID=UPI0025B60548|nr:hypothetical protein [Vibrio tapetis]MDN3678926.1 hypothetical protein [Vibrio tapetis subsp. quintayensis]
MNSAINETSASEIKTSLTQVTRQQAAIYLYKQHLQPGCEYLLLLNQKTLNSEKKEMRKQTAFRLSWVVLISSVVVLISSAFELMNIFTVVGLFAAYFVANLCHNLFSPEIALPSERNELFEFNRQLREVIVREEELAGGLLFELLRKKGLEDKAVTNGCKLEDGPIDLFQLDGNGLYQYLDAMNLVMNHQIK